MAEQSLELARSVLEPVKQVKMAFLFGSRATEGAYAPSWPGQGET